MRADTVTAPSSVIERPEETLPAPPARRSRRRGLWPLAVAVVALLLTLGVTWRISGTEPGTAPDARATTAFLEQFDEITTDLDRDRADVAGSSADGPAESTYDGIVQAIDAAEARYRSLDPPAALESHLEHHVAALAAERSATEALADATAAGDPVDEAVRLVLTLRTEAENLQRALRRTATALANEPT